MAGKISYEAIRTRLNKFEIGKRYQVRSFFGLLFVSTLKKYYTDSNNRMICEFQNGKRVSFYKNDIDFLIYDYDIEFKK